jgi:hypothetical protein
VAGQDVEVGIEVFAGAVPTQFDTLVEAGDQSMFNVP